MKRHLFAMALVLLSAALLLGSEEGQKDKTQAPSQHHEVVVTATRLETPAREIGSAVSVISAFDLSRFKKTFVLEALRDASAVSVTQNGGMGGPATGGMSDV